MTEIAPDAESGWGPEQLSELIRIRIEVLTAVQRGQFDEAAEHVKRALIGVVQSVPELPDTPESVVALSQVAGLLGDAAVVELGLGDPESAANALADMLNVEARLSNLTEPLRMVGMGWCGHGRRTLKPNGDCQFKPPCPT